MDFSQRSKLFADADRMGEKITMDEWDFVKKLKSLDIEQKDQLPIHIMYNATLYHDAVF